jgi:O-antigen/teichoic acid export membrane protein
VVFGPERRSYASRAFVGQLALAGIAVVGSVLAARLLGAHGKGVLTAWSLVAVLGALLLSGTIPVGLGRRYLAGDRSDYRTSTLLHGGAAFGLILLPAALCVWATGLNGLAILCFLLIGVPCGVVMEDSLLVLQASKRAWAYQAVRIANAGGLTIGLVWAVVFMAQSNALEDIAWISFAVGSVAGALLALTLTRAASSPGRGRLSLRQAAALGRGSFVTSITDWGLLRLDQLLLVAFAGPTALGVYSVAVNWTEVTQYVGHSIGQSMFQDVSELSKRQKRRILRRTVEMVGLLGVPLALAGLVFIPPLFGSGLADARWLVLLLVPGAVARCAAYTASQMLLGSGRGKDAARVQAVTLGASVPLWIIAIVVGGTVALAAAASLSYVMQLVLARRSLLKPGPERDIVGRQHPDEGWPVQLAPLASGGEAP